MWKKNQNTRSTFISVEQPISILKPPSSRVNSNLQPPLSTIARDIGLFYNGYKKEQISNISNENLIHNTNNHTGVKLPHTSSHQQINQQTSNIQPSHDSIFVSIASYRDPETSKTIEDLFLKAKYPHRVFVGVCQQNANSDPDCLTTTTAKKFSQNIRIIRMSHFDAQGPMYARSRIEQELFQDEMFFLQIDSHMLFERWWDEQCIQQLAQCPSDKPIITTYPHDFDRLTRKYVILPNGVKKPLGSIPPTFIRFREFHKRLKFSEQEKVIFGSFPTKPYPSLLWAAGFSFSLGRLIKEVPCDPNCPFIFVGEEMSMALRYYTHGWDLFAPVTNIVYHLLKRTYRKTFWEQVYKKECVVDEQTRQQRKMAEEQGIKRLHLLLRGKLNDNIYGLGKQRTIQEWEDYVGINIQAQTANERAFRGISPFAGPDEIKIKHGFLDFESYAKPSVNADLILRGKSYQNPNINRKTLLHHTKHQTYNGPPHNPPHNPTPSKKGRRKGMFMNPTIYIPENGQNQPHSSNNRLNVGKHSNIPHPVVFNNHKFI
jgi:hypothetical protein